MNYKNNLPSWVKLFSNSFYKLHCIGVQNAYQMNTSVALQTATVKVNVHPT